MKLGVIGSRHNRLNVGYEIGMEYYTEFKEIICAGMGYDDAGSHQYALRENLTVSIVPTDSETYGADAYHKRDLAILEMADKVILLTDDTPYFMEIWYMALESEKFLEGNMVSPDSPFYTPAAKH